MAESAVALKAETAEPNQGASPWQHVLHLPCDLTVDLPAPGFTVANLAELAKNSTIDSHWNVNEDVPLRVNGELVAWCEFEVVGKKLGVRVTELA